MNAENESNAAIRTPDQRLRVFVSSTLGELAAERAAVARAIAALARGDARQAASALGAADGLRQRAGLRPWPSTRRSEADLLARVSGKLGPQAFEKVFATGSQLNRTEAISLVRSLPEVG